MFNIIVWTLFVITFIMVIISAILLSINTRGTYSDRLKRLKIKMFNNIDCKWEDVTIYVDDKTFKQIKHLK